MIDVFETSPTIASQLPFVFPNGTHLDKLTVKCGRCDHSIPSDKTRGKITPAVYGYRAQARTLLIETVGYCQRCSTITRAEYRLHDDFSLTGISPHTGEWARWEPPQPPWWRRWLRVLRRLSLWT